MGRWEDKWGLMACMTDVEPTQAIDRMDLIHDAFRHWARRCPDAPALLAAHRTLTYAELDRWSDELAEELLGRGIGVGTVVPVVYPRSPDLIAVLLAVLKTGAAYSALDPAWPADRLRTVIERVAPGGLTVIGAEVDAAAFAQVCIDPALPAQIPDVPGNEDCGIGGGGITGAEPAMVFFTSGTTGESKAVYSPHRGTTRLTVGCPFAALGPGSVMPQVSAASWDAFALEVWGPLTTGGACAIPAEALITPAGLCELIRGAGVDTVFLTTSLFHLMVEEDVESFAGLATVLVGGERMSPGLAARFGATHPGIRLVNGYGPVESTIFALWHEVRDQDPAREVPLGIPCPSTRVLVLDGDRECAVEEIGEICVAGDGLALGYLGDPALTAERFVSLTVGGETLSLFRTGDRGWVDVGGVFHFSGRGDRQVKVRGHRIEPAGVERTAEAVTGVRRAAVLPVPSSCSGVESLTLFYRRSAGGPSEDELVRALRAVLPSYSLPDTVIEVKDFPMTVNGKLDKRRLASSVPTPASPPGGGDDFGSVMDLAVATGASTPVTVAGLVAEVLDRDAVDPKTEFFALGLTSMAAIRLASRLTVVFGRAVPVSQLMRTPTVAALSVWLDGFVSIPAVVEVDGSLRLTAAQTAFALANLDLDSDVASHCYMAWEVTGTVNLEALDKAIADIHRRHPYLGSEYDLVNGTARPGTAAPVTQLVPDDLLIETLIEPFDLADGRVWRVVFADGRERGVLALAIHHAAFDGQSQSILASDLALAYSARLSGREPDFAAPADPGPVLALIDQAAAQADPSAQRVHWVAALAGMPDLDLGPACGADIPAPAFRVALQPSVLDALDATARRWTSGRLAVLLHEAAAVLGELTGQNDFGIGVPVSLRLGGEAETVVGCLIDTVCVRVRPGHPGGLRHTIEAVDTALAHAELPFNQVVRATGRRLMGHLPPLYQVMVAVQESTEPLLSLPGAQASRTVLTTGAPPPTGLSVELFLGPDPELRVGADPRLSRVDLARAVADRLIVRLMALGSDSSAGVG